MYEMLDLSRWSPILLESYPSMMISPSKQGVNLNSVCRMDDFPLPVLPTIPIFCLGNAVKATLSIDGSISSRYFIETFLNSIFPSDMNYLSLHTLSYSFSKSSSEIIFVYSIALFVLTM